MAVPLFLFSFEREAQASAFLERAGGILDNAADRQGQVGDLLAVSDPNDPSDPFCDFVYLRDDNGSAEIGGCPSFPDPSIRVINISHGTIEAYSCLCEPDAEMNLELSDAIADALDAGMNGIYLRDEGVAERR